MDADLFQGPIWLLIAAVWGLVNWWGRRARARRAAEDEDLAPPISAPDGTERESAAPNLGDLLGRFRDALELPEPGGGEAVARVEPPVELPAEPSPSAIEVVEVVEPRKQAPFDVPTVRRRSRTWLGRSVARDLRRGRRTLMRAIVLNEILGPPVALRRGGRRGDWM